MGTIKIYGEAEKKFEPDYYEFHVVISVKSGMSGDVLSKGKYQTEELLRI